MDKKIGVITGCNSGIGKITAIELAKKGYEIVMLVRESEKSNAAFAEIKQASKTDSVKLMFVDLASLASIKTAAESIKKEYSKIDILINNAGLVKRKEEKSADGFEMTIAVNYLATYALTNHLLPLLRNGENVRIINLTSELYKSGKVYLNPQFSPEKFSGDKAYANSKLLVSYFTKELANKLSSDSITVNCVHPGVIGTDVFREYPRWFGKLVNLFVSKPADGAKPTIYLATSGTVENLTGKYFYKMKQKQTAAVANDMALATKIWEHTENITQVNFQER